MAWSTIGSIKGDKGDSGDAGSAGLSVAGAAIDGDGHLILTMSDASTVDAGTARGAPGGGIDFETSVQGVSDLPDDDAYGTARFVRDDGHLYVYEPAADRPENVDGWTDVGPIRGEQGDTGSAGTNGVSVTGANVNGAYELVLTLSVGGTINAGNVRGPAGADGSDGASGADGIDGFPGVDGSDGLRGTQWFTGEGGPVGSVAGSAVGDLYLDTTTGVVYKLNP